MKTSNLVDFNRKVAESIYNKFDCDFFDYDYNSIELINFDDRRFKKDIPAIEKELKEFYNKLGIEFCISYCKLSIGGERLLVYIKEVEEND